MNVGNAKNISQDARLYCLLIPTYVLVWFFYSELAHVHFLIPMIFFLDRDLVLRDYVVELFCRSMVGQ